MLIGGHYEILEFLGQGSMGAVYRVRDRYFEDYNRVVACKILPKELRQTPGRELYFKREFLAAQELVHQNICCTYEFGEDEDQETYFLIMEYVEGVTLREEINRKEYTLAQSLPLVEQIAAALDFAHQKGILHLDMKPDNIVLTSSGQIKIMDFGLARVINDNMTHVSLMDVEGTPLYMAPEQVDPKQARKRVDYAVDRWALGVILYEILAGYPPFDGRMGLTPLIYSILQASPEPLQIPYGAWKALQKMLAKAPRDRYTTCREFYRDLAAASISGTDYIPLRPLHTRKREKISLREVKVESPQEHSTAHIPLPQLKNSAQEVEPQANTEPFEAFASVRPTFISLGEAPDEILTETPFAEEPSQPVFAVKPASASLDGNSPRSRERNELPVSIWDQVKAGYSEIEDVERAQAVEDFRFDSLTPQKKLVYRHLHTGLDFVLIPSGSFWMGSPENSGKTNERPCHEVYLNAYFIATVPVPQKTWLDVLGENPSYFCLGGMYPVEQISWNDLVVFCERTRLQIPTEAQWENACRAGTASVYHWGDEMDGNYCWYGENSERATRPAALKKPNSWGLYDMCGNVWEWCRDDYSESAYRSHAKNDPLYLSPDEAPVKKVRRGGSWLNRPEGCRSAIRQSDFAERRASGLGARVCYSLYEDSS